jgi:hypothetical protein
MLPALWASSGKSFDVTIVKTICARNLVQKLIENENLWLLNRKVNFVLGRPPRFQ